jgi:hypothetical protein
LPLPVAPARRVAPDWMVLGDRLAHDTSCPGVGNWAMSSPTSAMMTWAAWRPMPATSSRRSTTGRVRPATRRFGGRRCCCWGGQAPTLPARSQRGGLLWCRRPGRVLALAAWRRGSRRSSPRCPPLGVGPPATDATPSPTGSKERSTRSVSSGNPHDPDSASPDRVWLD